VGYIDDAIDKQFQTTREGQKLFCPWHSSRGYLVPSDKQYARLRRGQLLWLKLGMPVVGFTAFFIFNYTYYLTRSSWTGLAMFFVLLGFYVACWSLWVHAQCRGLKKRYEND
jgi:hypothetical protein